MATRGRPVSTETLVIGTSSCLQVGAALIHLLETADHFDIDPWYGWTFVAIGVGQLASALAIVVRRRRRVFLLSALGNLLVVGIWIFTRAAGVSWGAGAGVRPTIEVADGAATLLEVASIILLCYLLARTRESGRVALPVAMMIGLGAVATPAVAVAASVYMGREACSHFDPKYGPLGTVDGHSILPREYPATGLRVGESRSVMSGLVVNCGSDEVIVTGVEIISEAGQAAEVSATAVRPLGRAAPDEFPAGDFAPVAVPATNDRPNWAVFSEVRATRSGFYSINGVRIRYRYLSESVSQVFATNVVIEVAGER